MLTLVFLAAAADLAFYYSFSALIALCFGGSRYAPFLAVVLLAACLTAAYALDGRGRARFAPLLAAGAFFLFPGLDIADIVAFIPAAAYVVYLVIKRAYRPEGDHRRSIFLWFIKIFPFFAAVLALFGFGTDVAALALPMAIAFLAMSVLLMRSLRHDPSVYTERGYQLTNLAAVLAVMGAAVFLGSRFTVELALVAVSLLYRIVIMPLLMGLAYVAVGLVWVLSKFLSLIISGERPEPEEVKLEISEIGELLGADTVTGTGGNILDVIFIALACIAAAVTVFFIFRRLAYRRDAGAVSAVYESRASVPGFDAAETERIPRGEVARVRAQYRRFLRLASERGVSAKRSDTSLDIERLAGQEAIDPGTCGEIRNIYILARYAMRAERGAGARMKALISGIKRGSKSDSI